MDMKPLEERAHALVTAATRAGADTADAVVASSRSTGVDIREGKLEESESAENDAFSLRVFVGRRAASVSANRGGDINTLAERAVAMAKAAPEDPFASLADADQLATSFAELDLLDNTDVDFKTMGDLARATESAALAVSGVTKSSGASFGFGLGGTVLATSHGFVGSYAASRFSLSVSAVAGEGTAMERDYHFDSQRHFTDLKSPDEIGRIAGEQAAARLNPQQVKTQSVPVVFAPRMARGLIGHVLGAINGSSVARKTTFLRDDMGANLFPETVTIVDEPFIKRGASSRPFDGEGVMPQDLTLVESGVLKTWLLDTATARELSLETNGRANRSGSSTTPGSTNVTLMPGQQSPEDLMKSVGTGFYVTELIGQGVNLITGDYSRGASGFWIENGEIAFPVSEITIAGSLRDMFASLTPANDLEKRFGVNAPTVLVEGLTLAGR